MGPVTPQTDVTPFLTPTTPTRTQMRWSPNASSSCSTAIRIPATHRGAHSPHSLEGDQQTKDPLRPLNRANSLASHTAPISGASGTSWDSSNYVYYNDSHKLQDYNFDSCSFPSSIFSPPVSPKEISVEQKSSVRPNAPPQTMIPPSNPYEGLKPTPFAPAYKGIIARPMKHPNLTTYGMFADTPSFANASQGNLHTIMSPKNGLRSAGEILDSICDRESSAIKASPGYSSNQPAANESPFSSEADIYPSSGVPLDDADKSGPVKDQHQSKTFRQLEAEKGIMKWNTNVFDDRWLTPPPMTVQSTENSEPSTSMAPTTQQVVTKAQDIAHLRHEKPESFLGDLGNIERRIQSRQGSFRPDLSVWSQSSSSPEHVKSFRGQQHSKGLVKEPPEPERLSKVIEEFEAATGSLPRGIDFHPEVLRRYFYDRVFQGDEAVPLHGPEKDNITKHAGRFISLAALRDQVLNDIEELVRFMTAPIANATSSTMSQRTPEKMSSDEEDVFRGTSTTAATCIPQWQREVQASKEVEGAAAEDTHTPRANPTHSSSGWAPQMQFLSMQERRQASQAFSAKLAANKGNTPSLVTAETSKVHVSASQHQEVKEEPATPEPSSLRKKQIRLLANASHHRSSTKSQDDLSLSQITLAPSEVSNSDTIAFSSMPIPSRDDSVVDELNQTQHRFQPFAYQFPGQHQHLPVGALPTGTFYPAGYQGPAQQMPGMQQGQQYIYQTTTGFQQSSAVPQSMQYGTPPMQFGYPQQNVGFAGPSTAFARPSNSYAMPMNANTPYENRGMSKTFGYSPPPMPHTDTVARPASNNRIASLVYRNNFAFPNQPFSQVRGTPPPARNFVQTQYEWQNRFGLPPAVKPNIPVLPYRAESDDMRPHSTGMASFQYQDLTRDGLPNSDTIKTAEYSPFTEVAKDSKPAQWGVMKIGNIPYDLTKSLILTFLGAHAKIIDPSLGPSVHIIMDRATGKTMDCFVEFYSVPDARACCNSINLRQHGLNRISDRVVDVSMSSQDELLAVLFPKAKNVRWENGNAVIVEAQEEWSSGFKNFVSAEELGLLVRHAEQPHRSNYTQRSPQRCYEAMISLLAKFPWHAVQHYKLSSRNQIFNATRQMLHILSINIRKEFGRGPTADPFGSPVKAYGGRLSVSYGGMPMLTENLLHDLLSAGLNAPGFSEKQRWELYEMCDYARHHFNVSPLLQHWPFEVLGRKMRVEEDVLELYAHIMHNNPEVVENGTSFGSFERITAGLDLESYTMQDLGEIEIKILNALLDGGIDRAFANQQAGDAGAQAGALMM